MSLLRSRSGEAARRQRPGGQAGRHGIFLCHPLRQVGVSGAHQAHVNLQRLATADALQFAVFNHAQQFLLHQHGRGGQFIKKQRTAVGALKASGMALLGAGKRTRFMAEELGVEQVFIQRRAVKEMKGPSQRPDK
jgi:hypothetical protein